MSCTGINSDQYFEKSISPGMKFIHKILYRQYTGKPNVLFLGGIYTKLISGFGLNYHKIIVSPKIQTIKGKSCRVENGSANTK